MQRIVLLCRHAEAYDPFPVQPDFERELTQNGQQQARNTGKWLRENFSKADAILASPAARANATARILAGRLYFDENQITYNPDLYNARESVLMKSLAELSEQVRQVILVAHNPGITRLARELTDELKLGYLEPANILAVALELDKWEDIYVSKGVVFDHFKG